MGQLFLIAIRNLAQHRTRSGVDVALGRTAPDRDDRRLRPLEVIHGDVGRCG